MVVQEFSELIKDTAPVDGGQAVLYLLADRVPVHLIEDIVDSRQYVNCQVAQRGEDAHPIDETDHHYNVLAQSIPIGALHGVDQSGQQANYEATKSFSGLLPGNVCDCSIYAGGYAAAEVSPASVGLHESIERQNCCAQSVGQNVSEQGPVDFVDRGGQTCG